MPSFASSVVALSLAASALAHQTIWSRSMYGVGWTELGAGMDFEFDAGDPFSPLGPEWQQDDWWFRGPSYRNLPPVAGEVSELKAGGSITFEIACHVAWTSFGVSPTVPGSLLDACPGNSGAYHSGDPADDFIDNSMLSGCALGIADVDNINDVTIDNLAIFSVNHECVKQKVTTFEIPAAMPPCTGDKCICGWFWLANNGTGNFYMTAFDCNVTGSPVDATPIMAPKDPNWCSREDWASGACVEEAGAKRPLYAYNYPTNVNWQGNWDRPGYHARWGFKNNGAQNDIFEPKVINITTSSALPSATTTSSVAVSSSTTVAASSSLVSTTTVAPVSTTTTTTRAAPSTTVASSSLVVPTTTSAAPSSTSAAAPSSVVPSSSSSSVVSSSTTVAPVVSKTSTTTVASSTTVSPSSSSTSVASRSTIALSSSSTLPPVVPTTTSTTVRTTTTTKAAFNPSSSGNVAAGATTSSSSSSSTSLKTTTVVPTTTTKAPVTTSSSTLLRATTTTAKPVNIWSLVVPQAVPTPSTTTTTKAATTTTSSKVTTTTVAPAPSATLVNLARAASVQASTENTATGQLAANVVSGLTTGEWATSMQKTGAWIKLSWDQPITFNQVVLFDRPDSANQVTGGTLTFSDGTFVTIGALQNDGKATYIDLPSVTSQSIVFMVTKVSSTTSSVGLAQFQVFLGDASKFTSTVSPKATSTSAALWSVVNPKRVKPTTTTTTQKQVAATPAANANKPASPSATSTKVVWTLVPTGKARRSVIERLADLKRNILPASNKQRHARDFTSIGQDFGADQMLVKESVESRCSGLDRSCEVTAEEMFVEGE